MKTTVVIQNLKCGGCANTISTKLSKLDGVSAIVVNVENASVSFNYETDNNVIAVKNKLAAMGYPAEGDTNTIVTKTKSFVSCAKGKMM